MRPDRRLHPGLLTKLIGLTAFVLTCSIVTVTWLSAHLTAAGLNKQRGQALGDDIRVYTTLVQFAATHRNWAGVHPELVTLARRDGRPIELTTVRRRLIADSSPGRSQPPALPAAPLATIDPLDVNTTLIAGAATGPVQVSAPPAPNRPAPVTPTDPNPAECPTGRCQVPTGVTATSTPGRIDPSATGPYLLSTEQQATLRQAALGEVACLKVNYNISARIEVRPSGRPIVSSPYSSGVCHSDVLDRPTKTETRALSQLTDLVNACLASQHAAPVKVLLGFRWAPSTPDRAPGSNLASSCIASSRAEQLAPYVAPPALVFVGSPASASLVSLSPASRIRIAEIAALVLLVTMTITILVAIRITRPLHALAAAARQVSRGDFSARVAVKNRDETGVVARAFNEMAERRQSAEYQRKAMVNDIAHELRTPASNILGWIEAAEDGLSEPAEALASLKEESLLLAHLIGDLQDLAAADAGELAIRPAHLDVADLLDSLIQANRATANERRVGLISHAPDQLAVTADPIRLRQAVANLVGNAIRHTPPDGVVTLTGRAEGEEVVIEVADTGPGIDTQDLPFIFDRFWRADKSRTRRTGGSGLGLAITRKLAEAHHGTVSAANGSTGAVFTLRIPAHWVGPTGHPETPV